MIRNPFKGHQNRSSFGFLFFSSKHLKTRGLFSVLQLYKYKFPVSSNHGPFTKLPYRGAEVSRLCLVTHSVPHPADHRAVQRSLHTEGVSEGAAGSPCQLQGGGGPARPGDSLAAANGGTTLYRGGLMGATGGVVRVQTGMAGRIQAGQGASVSLP